MGDGIDADDYKWPHLSALIYMYLLYYKELYLIRQNSMLTKRFPVEIMRIGRMSTFKYLLRNQLFNIAKFLMKGASYWASKAQDGDG